MGSNTSATGDTLHSVDCAAPKCRAQHTLSLPNAPAGADEVAMAEHKAEIEARKTRFATSIGHTRIVDRGVHLTATEEELPHLARAAAAQTDGPNAPLRHLMGVRTDRGIWLLGASVAEMGVSCGPFMAMAAGRGWGIEDAAVPGGGGWVCRVVPCLREAISHAEEFSKRETDQ